MIDTGYIALLCDDKAHEDEDQEPYGLEYGFCQGQEANLRKKACEEGWTSVRLPGASWRWTDQCPEHPREQVVELPDIVEIRA